MKTRHQLELSEMRRDWIYDAVRLFPSIGITKPFTTDQLHNFFTRPPHDNYWGSLMARLKKQNYIRKIGYKVSDRPSANSRPVSLWEVI